MKIALITCHFPPDSIGGGQVQSLRLCTLLSGSHEVTVYTRDYTGRRPHEERIGRLTYRRRRISRLPLVRSFLDLAAGLRFIRATRKEFDLFLSFHAQLAALMVVLGQRLFGVVGAVSPRGAEDFDFRRGKRSFQKFLYSNAGGILLQSETIRGMFLKQVSRVFPPEEAASIKNRTHIFPNIIERSARGRARAASGPLRVIYVGRLIDYKGVDVLLRAVRLTGTGVQLAIVGDGPDRPRLEALARGLPVTFSGEVGYLEVSRLISAADLFVLPSLTEHLPNAVLEALEAGLPVIATRVGAIPEIIREGRNGFLVDPGSAEQIAARLRECVEHPEKMKRMSVGALESIQPYLPESLLPKLEHELRTVVESHAHNT